MSSYVLGLQDIDTTPLMEVGGKGANLGELARMKGIRVPDGFCISTAALRRVIGESPAIQASLERLARLKPEDRATIGELSRAIRTLIEGTVIPEEITNAITRRLSLLGDHDAYAVRSSATAEDLPTASFAGQHDTYLNLIGMEAIARHVGKCWASLFTERAVMYRLRNGFDHRAVLLAVVVQKMIFPRAAGIMFTADPVTANRKVLSIDAGFGLGEALVAGLVNPDTYTVRHGAVIEKKIATKKREIVAGEGGGTREQAIEPERQNRQVLTDEEIVCLARLGRTIEEHFGRPQDIEWCLADHTFFMVQSRPITTLFPVPEAHDRENHVYISVGHQQMMTDPMKPLGLSLFQITAGRPMAKAGGRLFVDVTRQLASPGSRATLLAVMEQHDPLMHDALTALIARGDVLPPLEDDPQERATGTGADPQAGPEDFSAIASGLIKRNQAAIDELKRVLPTKAGPDLFTSILDDIQHMKKILFDPQNMRVIMAAMNASAWLNQKLLEWLGEKNAADTLSQSVPNNVTSEMGLALLAVADAIRPYPEVIAYLRQVRDDHFPADLERFPGGRETRDAIQAFLATYGMRCVGEIDITRPRWSEKPTTLIPLILGNIKNFAPGARERKFTQGLREAEKKEQEVVARLKQLPDGDHKAAETTRMIRLLRTLSGYREYPKYSIVQRYFVYKQALLREAEPLVRAGVLRERDDIFYLTFDELREVVRTRALEERLIGERKAEHEAYEKLTPPRVITSEGEIIVGRYTRENIPGNALVGLPVSSGVVEGRARVIRSLEDADLEAGDILVTAFTDPSWTPLFVSITGLVTEVGGLMTHGAVIAREYGLPAVVGVEHATTLIKDGQRIRVHGTEGYVEILS